MNTFNPARPSANPVIPPNLIHSKLIVPQNPIPSAPPKVIPKPHQHVIPKTFPITNEQWTEYQSLLIPKTMSESQWNQYQTLLKNKKV